MGYDAARGAQGAFFIEIYAEPNEFSYEKFEPNYLDYLIASFFDRSDFARLFKRLQKSFS